MRDPNLLSFVLLVGLAPITGSFMGLLIHRIPAGRNVGLGRSECDVCGHMLTAFDLLPVVNWVLSRGRCRFCGAGVSFLYPLIELPPWGRWCGRGAHSPAGSCGRVACWAGR